MESTNTEEELLADPKNWEKDYMHVFPPPPPTTLREAAIYSGWAPKVLGDLNNLAGQGVNKSLSPILTLNNPKNPIITGLVNGTGGPIAFKKEGGGNHIMVCAGCRMTPFKYKSNSSGKVVYWCKEKALLSSAGKSNYVKGCIK
jgi:hypothetical protein